MCHVGAWLFALLNLCAKINIWSHHHSVNWFRAWRMESKRAHIHKATSLLTYRGYWPSYVKCLVTFGASLILLTALVKTATLFCIAATVLGIL